MKTIEEIAGDMLREWESGSLSTFGRALSPVGRDDLLNLIVAAIRDYHAAASLVARRGPAPEPMPGDAARARVRDLEEAALRMIELDDAETVYAIGTDAADALRKALGVT